MRRTLTAEIDFEIDLLDLHEADPERYPYLLESAGEDGPFGHCDLLFAFPQQQIRLDASFQLHGAPETEGNEFLASLDTIWVDSATGEVGQERLAAFTGGWFLLLGYELAQQIEPSLALTTDSQLPVALATRIPAAVIRDRRNCRALIIVELGFGSLLDKIRSDVQALPRAPRRLADWRCEPLSEAPAEDFLDAVARAQKYIAAGDIFQSNLSRRWSGRLPTGVRPSDVYRQLRAANPAPFAGLAVDADFAIISSSPERLLRAGDGKIETRPIAGTRPRDSDLDHARIAELLAHPKEQAEHVMLIDLERNDLGRICKPGSVMVDEFMVVESYAHVHHIVSNVSGVLRELTTPGQMIRAVFPGGTITGCPKVRCMEIIHELEGRPRGFYTGAMGYLNHDGSMDLNILIRTITSVGEQLSVATGSGIVADSNAWQELEETRAKARGMLIALEREDSRG